jgi:hypothetical protein
VPARRPSRDFRCGHGRGRGTTSKTAAVDGVSWEESALGRQASHIRTSGQRAGAQLPMRCQADRNVRCSRHTHDPSLVNAARLGRIYRSERRVRDDPPAQSLRRTSRSYGFSGGGIGDLAGADLPGPCRRVGSEFLPTSSRVCRTSRQTDQHHSR